ncbi:hypothetical protein OP10G_3602 [Fimbriimonas ginsengisoli Gsoil 348]|uniref:Uncharacterized protein n=1 Tax=Fimbriimonas ginsengisoli Gsoil 348 TaxID=661478 RepID=A0A068NW14_FIMGI|nr:hypothetical protein OP10G_3602 [Fimbriimonas ginsengisoli Gsoil 348]
MYLVQRSACLRQPIVKEIARNPVPPHNLDAQKPNGRAPNSG